MSLLCLLIIYEPVIEHLANIMLSVSAHRLPFVAGALSGARGVQSLQPFILALLITLTIIWVLLPQNKNHAHAV